MLVQAGLLCQSSLLSSEEEAIDNTPGQDSFRLLPQQFGQQSVCLCKIPCVFTAALTYIDAVCKSSCMRLKWHEMQILKRGWCFRALGCPWLLCGLSTRPPSHLGIFGKPFARWWHAQPGNPSRVPSHCNTRAGGLSPELRGHKLLPLAWQKVPDLSKRDQLWGQTSPWLHGISHPLLKVPIRGAIRAICGCMLQYKNPSHTGNLHTYLALLVPW